MNFAIKEWSVIAISFSCFSLGCTQNKALNSASLAPPSPSSTVQVPKITSVNCSWTQLGTGAAGTQNSCTLSYLGDAGPQSRSFAIHLPQNLDATLGAVIDFSGSGTTAASALALWTPTSDTNGFVVVAPQLDPCENGWGNSCADDGEFFLALQAIVQSKLNCPIRKLFLAGFSSGAVYIQILAHDYPQLVAAIALGEGALFTSNGVPTLSTPISAPVSIIQFAGDNDPTAHYCGLYTSSVSFMWSTDMVVQWWSGQMGCQQLDSGTLCTKLYGVPTNLTQYTATNCSRGTEFKFYRLSGGLHQWYSVTPLNVAPGSSTSPFNSAAGVTIPNTQNDIAWQFFQSHPHF